MTERVHQPPAEPRLLRQPPRGNVLLFAPHPDDEVLGAGGALCLHRRQGDRVRVVIATDGRSGDPDGKFRGGDYAAHRRAESQRGAAALGVDDLQFWGFPDGCVLSQSDLDLGIERALGEIRAFAPAVIYLPWAQEGHPDHHALHRIALTALARAGFTGPALAYEVWNAMVPDVVLDITPVVDSKRQAMQCHQSQFDYVDYQHVVLGLNAYRSLAHGRGRGWFEGFQVVSGQLVGD